MDFNFRNLKNFDIFKINILNKGDQTYHTTPRRDKSFT